jgi:hypothetical protein
LLQPSSGTKFAEFRCSVFGIGYTTVWSGSIIAEITKPALGVEASEFTLVFAGNGAYGQQYEQVEEAGPSHHLTESRSGGAPDNLSITMSPAPKIGQYVTFEP